MHRFYLPDFVGDKEMRLPADEAQHLARVLRLATGDTIAVFDGKGREALARVVSVAPRGVSVAVLAPRSPAPEPAVAVTLAQALLKSDKMDRVIRDAVMLGVTTIQPLVSRRIDVARAAWQGGGRRERWERTVMSSVKQCGRAVVPQVLDPLEFGALLTSTSDRVRLMFVEPGGADPAAATDVTGAEGPRPSDAVVLIGPEGGWDPQELRDAAAAGVQLLRLGTRVLRADAAGAVAVAVLRHIWRDL